MYYCRYVVNTSVNSGMKIPLSTIFCAWAVVGVKLQGRWRRHFFSRFIPFKKTRITKITTIIQLNKPPSSCAQYDIHAGSLGWKFGILERDLLFDPPNKWDVLEHIKHAALLFLFSIKKKLQAGEQVGVRRGKKCIERLEFYWNL